VAACSVLMHAKAATAAATSRIMATPLTILSCDLSLIFSLV
jgi:hypothetical protein